jgi:hypothetical protein
MVYSEVHISVSFQEIVMYQHIKDNFVQNQPIPTAHKSQKNFISVFIVFLAGRHLCFYMFYGPHMRISWWAKSIAMHFVVQMPTS